MTDDRDRQGRERVVVTGIGLITAIGTGVDPVWQALLEGRSGVRRITQFDASSLPCQIAGEIPDFRAEDYLPVKEARRMARCSQVALGCAQKAYSDAGLDRPLPYPEEVGVCFGTAIGGIERVDEGIQAMRGGNGYGKINPFVVPSGIPNMPAFHIAAYFGAVGPNLTITTACATGSQTIGEGAEMIRHHRARVVLAGGVEALIKDFALGGFASMHALPTNYNDDPTRASRPFDARREGFVFAEGAACLVLESLNHARKRGARIYAEVAGQASSSDAYHMAAPEPTGAGALRTMRWALADAGINLDQVDYINAHGTSTPANDSIETMAIKQLFGEHAFRVPISSTKSMIGHAMGASGAIEAAVCALTIARGLIHPTVNYEFPDPACDLDYVPNAARERRVRVALSNSFGLGGQDACLVLKELEA